MTRTWTVREEIGMLVNYHEFNDEAQALRQAKKPGCQIIEAPEDWTPPNAPEPDKHQPRTAGPGPNHRSSK